MVKPMEQIRATLELGETEELSPLPRLHVQFDHEIQVLPSIHLFSEYEFTTELVGRTKRPVMHELGMAVTVQLDRELAEEGDRRVFVRRIEASRIAKARYAAAALLAMIPEVEYQDFRLASGVYVSAAYMNEAWTWLTKQGRATYTMRDGFEAMPLRPQ
jgi:hypothetical protein